MIAYVMEIRVVGIRPQSNHDAVSGERAARRIAA
jgi:hypothetical protein